MGGLTGEDMKTSRDFFKFIPHTSCRFLHLFLSSTIQTLSVNSLPTGDGGGVQTSDGTVFFKAF